MFGGSDGNRARVDMRSASRVGESDGCEARVAAFLADLGHNSDVQINR